jgi:hypothetical protein
VVISSSSLFHFTNEIEKLENILSNEFHPNYSLENYIGLFSGLNIKEEQAIPMVCFCDLPLSQVGEHIGFYGNYGIGLCKEWGISKGINPVMYLQPKSYLANHITDMLRSIIDKKDAETGLRIFEMMSFVKSYQGRLFRQGGYSDEKTFYNEREWRYVPAIPDSPTVKYAEFFTLSKEDYMDPEKLRIANEEYCSRIKLPFTPKDIKYIIVSKESEILPMVKAIENIKGGAYTYGDLKTLTTRIITAEQIKKDF